jgi:hypothetical protein
MFPKPPGPKEDNETDWLSRSTPNSPAADSGRTLTPKQAGLLAASSAVNDLGASSANPFSDPNASSSAPNLNSEFAPVETIKRPFAPSLDDELAVTPGDFVRVVKVFDDGWAYVEKIGASARGLIPLDCMRDAGQDLPAFLASKRVSSYIGDGTDVTTGNAI